MVFALVSVLLPTWSPVEAEPPAKEPEVKYQPVTEIEWEAFEVQATLNGPSMTTVFEPGRIAFSPLIRLRANFNTELEASAHEVR